ncbi:MAG: DUF4857 domain-containing protein [Tannerella sp.]|nr:DUF4857 domain-containing protein [Tannerella sp.]
MIRKKYTYYIILVFITIMGIWLIPSLVKKATCSPDDYPFVYYSSMMKEFGIVDYKDKKTPLSDLKGNKFTTAQFDSLMPLLNFRQLMSDGRLPDSIGGIAITPPLLRSKSVVFRYTPKERQTPDGGLYIMFESMPKRVGLEMPEDVFRMKNEIEFIDVQTNAVNREKSDLFAKALEKAGYSFPAQWSVGNPNPRKAYDEGYFSLDDKRNLYHLKMANNRPFVRNTRIAEIMDIAWFSMYEAPDKRFYGFLFDKQGGLYIVESRDGKYAPLKLDIPPVDITKDQVVVMGNLLYWTVSVTTLRNKSFYGLETETLKKVAEYSVDRQDNKWDKASKWLFPYYLTFQDPNSDYIYPQIRYTGAYGYGANILLAVVSGIFISGSRNRKIFNILFIILTGVAGMIALLLLPKGN